jgi:hypothetical protein
VKIAHSFIVFFRLIDLGKHNVKNSDIALKVNIGDVEVYAEDGVLWYRMVDAEEQWYGVTNIKVESDVESFYRDLDEFITKIPNNFIEGLVNCLYELPVIHIQDFIDCVESLNIDIKLETSECSKTFRHVIKYEFAEVQYTICWMHILVEYKSISVYFYSHDDILDYGDKVIATMSDLRGFLFPVDKVRIHKLKLLCDTD